MQATNRMAAAELHKRLPEAEFQRQVIRAAERLGWYVWHDQDSRRNTAGMPDLFLVRPPRVVLIELKREKGRVRPEQAALLEKLSRCPGVEAFLIRPSQWDELLTILGYPNAV